MFFGRAEPVEVDWHQAMGAPPEVDRREFVRESLAEAAEQDTLIRRMMTQRPSADRWAAYRTRYQWRPAFGGLGTPDLLERVEFANGERDNIRLPLDAASAGPRSAPSLITFAEPGSGRYYRVRLDDEEVAATFARLGGGGQPIDLVFAVFARTGAGGHGLTVQVRGAPETVTLRHVTFE